MKVYEAKLTFSVVREEQVAALTEPSRVITYIKDAFEENPVQESFWVILLNAQNMPIARQMVTLGTLTSSLVHPRETFRAAILANAHSIIIAHNHPSGKPTPSEADRRVTTQIKNAGQILGIELLDHIIVGDPKEDVLGKGYYSFRDCGHI